MSAARTYALAAILFVAARAGADEPPTYDAAACNTCHASLLARKQVHSLFPGGTCADCHAPAAEAGKCKGPVAGAKGWKLTEPEPKLCLNCHEEEGKGAGAPHTIIGSGGCTSCHDAHSSDNPNQLTTWPPGDLCRGCHDPSTQKSVHTPVAKGDCLGCHDPHIGAVDPLLKTAPPALCATCHKPEKLAADPVKHTPVAQGRCLDCHAAHASDHPKQLVAEGKALCLTCHDQGAKTGGVRPALRVDLGKKDVHPAVETGDCQDCHAAGHSAKIANLLAKPPAALCADCHDRKEDAFVHGAVRAGDCAGCHDPHSSSAMPLLRDEGAALCFRCHDDDVTGRASIHTPVRAGKCADCHEPHGSASPFSLKTGAGDQACLSCHKGLIKEGAARHAALDRGGCVSCHDAHGSANPDQLLMPVNALCQSCHPAITDGRHATTFVPGGHKIAGGPDPQDPKRDFSCASCHDPHASASPKLLRYGTTTMESCDVCHGDRSGQHPELKDIHRAKRPPEKKP